MITNDIDMILPLDGKIQRFSVTKIVFSNLDGRHIHKVYSSDLAVYGEAIESGRVVLVRHTGLKDKEEKDYEGFPDLNEVEFPIKINFSTKKSLGVFIESLQEIQDNWED